MKPDIQLEKHGSNHFFHAKLRRHPTIRGFTLIEVSIAVVVLAASLTTIYGLQAANTRVTLHISGENRAMLLARQLFAMMQSRPQSAPPLPEQTVDGTFEQVYNALNIRPPLLSEESLVRYRVKLTIDRWPVGDLLQRPIKRMQLDVFWGTTDYDHLHLTYFLPPETSAT